MRKKLNNMPIDDQNVVAEQNTKIYFVDPGTIDRESFCTNPLVENFNKFVLETGKINFRRSFLK